MQFSKIILRIIIYSSLITLAVLFLIPFILLFMATLRGPTDFHTLPIWVIPPKIHLWSNFLHWIHGGFWGSVTNLEAGGEKYQAAELKETWLGLLAFGNSMFYGIFGAVGGVGVASLAAYALAKIRFRGSYAIFLLLIAMMFFPPQIFMLPFVTLLQLAYITF